MIVAVIGLGYVGAVSAAGLARLGHRVIGVDADPHKAEAIRGGQAPVAEPGLDELVSEGTASGRLTVGDLPSAVAAADAILVAVGTPSASGGGLDLSAVSRVASEIGAALPEDGRFRVVVLRSTVLPGTVDETIRPILESASGRRAGTDFGLATNPEFLREGCGVSDFFAPSRTIIGADDDRTAAVVRDLYAGLEAPSFVVPIRVAEMSKYADNAFHALKIAFANEIGAYAREHGLDGRAVMQLLTSDTRLNVSAAYLSPGYAFGGSCLPKDLRALTASARRDDVDLPLLQATLVSNDAHFQRGLRLVEELAPRAVAVVGLSFKPDTDDLRESPAVALAERLLGRGFELSIFDDDIQPDQLRGANRAFIERQLPHLGRLLRGSVEETVRDADVVVVTKRSNAVTRLPSLLRSNQSVVDLVGLDWLPQSMAGRYVGIAW